LPTLKSLKGKTVWITGASSGIGKALAIEFAKEGSNLILTARNEEKLNEVKDLCKSDNCLIVPADLSKVDELESLVKHVNTLTPKIDILINNAGISQRSFAKETGLEIDRKIMELNFFSAVALTKLVLPNMLATKSGHIAVISSISGKFGFPLRTAYAASKHALQGFFESLRAELKQDNIQVTIVSPGRIKTNISLSAVTKDGTAHGEMDPGQENGIDASICAKKIVKGLKKNKKELLIGGKEILLVYIHRFLPFLYHRIVNKISAK
jgi:dehydrogenase/reductase SDR family protein 7B